jgi:hypothetical protein
VEAACRNPSRIQFRYAANGAAARAFRHAAAAANGDDVGSVDVAEKRRLTSIRCLWLAQFSMVTSVPIGV